MSAPFGQFPSTARITPHAFKVSIPQEQLTDLHTLVKLSKLGPRTYENSHPDARFGITSVWLTEIREKWLNDFDWKACEARINDFPQFKTEIEDIQLHFAALFSEKPDAVPIVLLHGWPGSFLEFLPLLQLFRDEFTPSTLPYHLIVPSLPGYGFSSGPPVDRNYTTHDAARVIDKLMKDLGFESGYIAQGGDIGSRVSRFLAVDHDSCKDEPLPSQTILEFVTLYWLTDTFPRGIYPYREELPISPEGNPLRYIHKPLGFSYFPVELFPVPKSWVETTGNLVFWREHQRGGHFAALEKPKELKADLAEFVEQIWSSI